MTNVAPFSLHKDHAYLEARVAPLGGLSPRQVAQGFHVVCADPVLSAQVVHHALLAALVAPHGGQRLGVLATWEAASRRTDVSQRCLHGGFQLQLQTKHADGGKRAPRSTATISRGMTGGSQNAR